MPRTQEAPPAAGASTRRLRRWVIGLALVAAALVLIWAVVAYVVRPQYAPTPPLGSVANAERRADLPAYDVWGRNVSHDEARELLQTPEGRALLSPSRGAVAVDDALLTLGRRAFYEETFGNEYFLSDVVGLLDGPLPLRKYLEAIWALDGAGTTDLKVELAETVTVAGRTFAKGTKVSTGIDVPKGGFFPLGLRMGYSGGRVRAGITCALCHAAVDPATGSVVEGAPNADVNAGLLIALSPNSAAYFANTEVGDLQSYVKGSGRTAVDSGGRSVALPDPRALEDAVDAVLLRWPPGHFDSTTDLKSNPSQIPDSFTRGGHPFGWTGFAMAGPFRGLSMLGNNVHALNADALAHTAVSEPLFGIDKEVYIATLLQNASYRPMRYDPAGGRRASEFLASVRPTQAPAGMSHYVAAPTFPKASVVAPNGLWISPPGRPAWQQVNAMAAFQEALLPPSPPLPTDPDAERLGRAVFARAGCAECHAGPFGTNNKVLPVEQVGTDPARAPAMAGTEAILADPLAYAFDTPVPIPDGARTLPVPLDRIDRDQLRLAWALGGSKGGYKVKGLVGLYWTAPYLHDGGVAVGPDAGADVGVSETTLKGVRPDPANSLRALVDRDLRRKVIAANEASGDLRAVHVRGVGHEYWADAAAGFSAAEQKALIHYLLTWGNGE